LNGGVDDEGVVLYERAISVVMNATSAAVTGSGSNSSSRSDNSQQKTLTRTNTLKTLRSRHERDPIIIYRGLTEDGVHAFVRVLLQAKTDEDGR
jgi:hypothetical protein